MKKKLLLLASLAFFSKIGFSQYYYLPSIGANRNPSELNKDDEYPVGGGLSTTWVSILGPAVTTPAWSAQTNLPFAFQFNGAAVTAFKVSSTGILTFNTAATTVPASTPAALPSASIPDNSVCVWGIEATGTNDNIVTKTFGTAPNRQYWIQFNSCTYAGLSTSYCYWSIVLEETTNHIYIVDQRTATPGKVTLGVQINATTAVQVSGSPGNIVKAGTNATPADNTYYKFIYGTQAPIGIALNLINPAVGEIAWGVVNSTKTISGTIQNEGSSPITSFTAKYSVAGGAEVSSPISSINITSGQTYNFTITQPYTIPSTGQYPVKVWVELSGDTNKNNDTLKTQINGSSFLPQHKVVMEEGTGTWCGWCVRGTVFMDSIAKKYPTTVIPIAVHNGDPMVNTVYDAGMAPLLPGYPGLLVGRTRFNGDPSDAFTEYDKQKNDYGMADLTVTPSYNAGTRVATITVDTKAAFSVTNNNSANNDYRIAVVFTEDHVKGTASGYNQANYYSGGTSPMAGAGHNFQTEPNPVLAANMSYDFVAREILGGFKGQANSLPNVIADGSTYTNSTFSYTVPATYNVANMKVHALLIDAKNNIVLNGNSASLAPVGITSIVSDKQTFSIYPNPVESSLNINLSQDEADQVSISIFNNMGQIVSTKNFGKVLNGQTVLSVDVNELPSGAYSIQVNTSKGTATGKFIK